MSNYLHPYCTIDKLRISKANGIRFIYLTDSEGSFFDGENIPDNEFYNDQSNCGFNWEPFAQQIPCDGIVRFQFQWCDDKTPYVQVFQEGAMLYELTPTLVSDGEYAMYEQEINFSTETDLCNTCIDIRINTHVVGGLSFYLDQQQGKTFVRTGDEFEEEPIDPTFTALGVSTFEGGAVLVASDLATTSKFYKWNNGWELLYTTTTGVFYHVKAFSDNDFVSVSKTTLGYAVFSKNGTITEEAISDPSYFYGIGGEDIDNIHAWSQVPFGQAKIFSRVSDTWGIWFDYGEVLQVPTGSLTFFVKNSIIYAGFGRAGSAVFNTIPLSSGYDEQVLGSGSFSSLDILDSETMAMASSQNLYLMSDGNMAIDSTFSSIRTEYGDASNIASVSYQSDGRIIVITQTNSYIKSNGSWAGGVDGIPDPIVGVPLLVGGYYTFAYAYHAQSEPIKISNSECLKKIEYWNDDDYDYQVFCQGFRNIVYVQMQQTAFRPMEERTEYTTSQNVRKVLSSNLSQITVWDLNYMPQYLHEILWRTFGMDNVEVDGVSYTKEGDYSIAENSAPYSLWKSSVELYKNLFKFTNSNCNRCIPSTRGGIGVMIIGDTFIVT